ncbi:MAG TPA: response regulator [Myxococcales bacterium]|jgi:DNA-binding response OmpR family regulator/signal transduction histidine kinase
MTTAARRPAILFVDDEADVVDILARTFERTYEVATATSPEQALEMLKSRPFDLLVTDQKMPGCTGIELVGRAREAGLDFTAILLTGYTDPQDLIDAINKGQVFRYITKPWDVTEFFVTVKNALDHHALRQERERLVKELTKRLDALNLLHEVTRAGAAPVSYETIIARVVEAVPRIIPFDLAAALIVVEPGKNASLLLHRQAESGEAALLLAKDQALAAWASLTGERLKEDKVVTRVSGRGAAAASTALAALPSVLTAPLAVDGKPAGVLLLLASRPDAFSEDDARLLEVLANQTAATVRGLAAVLGTERRRIERMVECMADGVILTDARNELVVINPAARSLLQIDDPAKATAKYLQEVLGFYPFELVRGWEYGGAQILREEVKIFERTLHSTVSPVTDASGQLAGVVVVLRDISEQKKLEARKEEFVSILSHELRTPLTAVSGALDLVLNNIAGDINDKQRRFLDMARDSTDKLNTMVDDLLDLAKFERGKMRMSFEVVYLDEQVKAAVERYGAAATEKKIHLGVRVPPEPVKVVADPVRLSQVLNNLLTNAIKFSTAGGHVEVELKRPAHLGRFAVVSCWNDGEAIAEADLERIFDKFEQGGSVRTRAVRGTGLGLAICRSIVQAHGGRIWAESAQDKGARFVVVVPIEPGNELAVAEDGEDPAPAQPAGGRTGTVLVVDDEPDIAYILKALLLSRGHKALVAFSAEEALSLARKHHPDVVTCDVRMPEVDGLSLAEILRHDPETRHARLVVVSVFDERERAFRAGASAFLQKPIDVPRLLATVDGLVQQRAGAATATVLVVDDDPAIRAICSEVLANVGYRVIEAGTMVQARGVVREQHPDMLLLDIVLPDGDGLAFLEELKEERAARHMSAIFITAKGETSSKVRALKLGADDYLVKPFDALELAARVETVLRRKEAELGASPTTRLPGSVSIEREVMRRFEAKERFALCYLDLDNLKAYNDHYGYAKADGVVQQTGDLLREVVAGEPGTFLGHVAGDDFVYIVPVERVDEICQQVVDAFDRVIPLYYDADDRKSGFIDAEDRYKQRRRFPIMSVSVAAVVNDGRFGSHAEIARAAADLKLKAKQIPGSKFIRSDREGSFASRTRTTPVVPPPAEPPVAKSG